MTRFHVVNRLTANSADPYGRGIPHNTEANAEANRAKSDDELIDECEERNALGLDTWQIRNELYRRAQAAGWEEWERRNQDVEYDDDD